MTVLPLIGGRVWLNPPYGREIWAWVSKKAQIVEAEAKAQATVEMARGQAEANRILAESLTEPLLRNAWIEAIKESGNAIVVPDGSTPFVQVPTPTE